LAIKEKITAMSTVPIAGTMIAKNITAPDGASSDRSIITAESQGEAS
jgi:hypothetical protein